MILPDTRRRDTIVAVLVGAVLLVFVAFGVMTMSKPHESANTLLGVVVAKQFTPQKEQQVSFSGRRLEGTKEIDGEYVLKVRVEKESRTYEVPVEKPVYLAKKEGDSLEFVRPRSEQR
ncbi:MAG: hypothetical protein WCF18_03070 [Chthoniobacteraceae bacterium]